VFLFSSLLFYLPARFLTEGVGGGATAQLYVVPLPLSDFASFGTFLSNKEKYTYLLKVKARARGRENYKLLLSQLGLGAATRRRQLAAKKPWRMATA